MNNNEKMNQVAVSGTQKLYIIYFLPCKQNSNDSYGNFYIDKKMQGYHLHVH